MCSLDDSVDVKTKIIGGTPPYLTIWSTGDTSRNTTNLAPNPTLPYVLTISDANFCSNDQYLTVPFVLSMNTFMSSVGEICKDDYSGSARVFVTNGTPPFKFVWDIMPMTIFSDDSSSEIENLIVTLVFLSVVVSKVTCSIFGSGTIEFKICFSVITLISNHLLKLAGSALLLHKFLPSSMSSL